MFLLLLDPGNVLKMQVRRYFTATACIRKSPVSPARIERKPSANPVYASRIETGGAGKG
jgi:hypothetical protein